MADEDGQRAIEELNGLSMTVAHFLYPKLVPAPKVIIPRGNRGGGNRGGYGNRERRY